MKNTDSGIIGTKIVLSSIKTNDIHHLCDFFSKPYIRDKEYRDKSLENREGERARTLGRYQNVFLSAGELSELQADFPTVWQEYIERLSEYMASTGRTYKSHAATIRRWIADDRRKAAPPARDRDYSVKDGDTV